MTYILWLDSPDSAGDPRLGGKFASLAEMTAAGFTVPGGFGVTTDAYRAFLAAAGLAEQARETRRRARGAGLETVESLSAAMTRAVESAPMPAEVEDAIRGAYAALAERAGDPAAPVAVRSSGESEDLAGASFAGQYHTYLWVSGADQVLAHVRRCWAGMFGPAVLTYRPAAGQEEETDFAICVGVQEMVPARCAGVVFTLDPVTGDRSKVVIEGCWGLGEGVVSGAITPSRFVVDKVTFERVGSSVAVQETMFALDPGTGTTGLVDVPAELREQSCLTDDQIRELAGLAKRIERHRGAAQDIEWALGPDGGLRVLQVRPETVWSNRARERLVSSPARAIDQVVARFAGIGVTRGPGRA
ncbi:pyruvate,water dikinase [Thermocatellispora tengchongensis]|uniref:Phosphoenolpyruvate synthase n=1 Tax=Thermocatellispora tengchongensis TaxID=1073253 RepID=A0A840PGG9_9ACTN|nr:PEP/pyruvate-binding domain-containing protein [Thermocatellispora tengchongensis]MBB5137906.1 pyruvate,water dikinase [Thermocatellispora tengchongensis]